MLDEEIAKAVVNDKKPEEIIDGVIEVLVVAQRLLEPGQVDGNLEFSAGCATQEISHATQVLRAFRNKQYGDKPITTL